MSKIQLSQILKDSIIVAAHPDDEILWFSSLIDKVDKVLICYLKSKSNISWNEGRKKTLFEYPIKTVSSTSLYSAEVHERVNWQNPVITQFGVKIINDSNTAKRYQENYYLLKKTLKSVLQKYTNVITHNPWGEYGHAEHIQTYRIVKELQEELNFRLWFSNYCSNRSFPLMMLYFPTFNSKHVRSKTNKILSGTIINIYKKNKCWTWYDDWEYFDEESFLEDKVRSQRAAKYGSVWPLNMVRVPVINSREIKLLSRIKFYYKVLYNCIQKTK